MFDLCSTILRRIVSPMLLYYTNYGTDVTVCTEKEGNDMRKYYLDNIKWLVIVLVVVNHVISIFSSNGSVMSYNAKGIAAFDVIGYFIYPWFMPILFVIGGMNARYSLQHRTTKEFRKERVLRLLIPFLAYLLLIGPFAAQLAFKINHYDSVFKELPSFVVIIIRLLNGMGPSWFLLQMFLLSFILLLIKRLDRKERLLSMSRACNVRSLLLLYIPVFISAQILYVAFTFRNGLYLFLFLLGYYLFSEEKVQDLIEKWGAHFLSAGAIIGVLQCYISFGKSYQEVVNHWSVMLYTWLMILGVMGCFKKWLNVSNHFTRYMNKRSFGIYLFHYVPMVYIAYFLTTYFNFPYLINYLLVFVLSFASSIFIYEIMVRIPLLNVCFGLKKE